MEQHQNKSLPIKLFYSCARSDEKLRDQLAKHLSQLKREGLIEEWHDRLIVAGTDWSQTIDQAINTAHIILLLISPDFLASDYCYQIEMQQVLERYKRGEVSIIPIILRPCDWQTGPFVNLQCLPRNGKAITVWDNRDKAFLDVTQSLRQTIQHHVTNITIPPTEDTQKQSKELLSYEMETQLKRVQENQIGILVAEFSEGASGEAFKDRTITQVIIDHLGSEFAVEISSEQKHSEASTNENWDVIIIPYGKAIHPLYGEEMAHKLGKQYRTALVIWGWFSKTETNVLVTAHFQIVEEVLPAEVQNRRIGRAIAHAETVTRSERRHPFPGLFSVSEVEGRLFRRRIFGISELHSFNLHFDLSEKIIYLTTFTLGILHYLGFHYQVAAAYLQKVLDNISRFNERSGFDAIYFFLGNAYYYPRGAQRDHDREGT